MIGSIDAVRPSALGASIGRAGRIRVCNRHRSGVRPGEMICKSSLMNPLMAHLEQIICESSLRGYPCRHG